MATTANNDILLKVQKNKIKHDSIQNYLTEVEVDRKF